MKKNAFLLIFSLFFIAGHAQMTKLGGIVKVQNSKVKTGQIEYVSGVQIEHEGEKAKSDISDSNGRFSLQFVGVHPNTQIMLKATPSGKYKNYIVVNKRDIESVTLGRIEDLSVYLCDESEFEKRFQELYEINLAKNEENYSKEINRLNLLLTKAKEKEKHLRFSHLEDSLRMVENVKNNMASFIRDISEKMIRIDLDESDDTFQKAYAKVAEGDLDSALLYIPKDMLKEKYMQGEILEKAGYKLKKDVIQTWILRARIYTLTNFEEACSNYEEALGLDPSSFELHFEYIGYLKVNNKINAAKNISLKFLTYLENNMKQTGMLNIGGMAKLHFILGDLYSSESNYENSSKQYDLSEYYYNQYKIIHNEAVTSSIVSLYMMRGQDASSVKDWEKSEEYNLKALELLNKEEGEEYLEEKVNINVLLAERYRRQLKYVEAIPFLKKGIELYEKIKPEERDEIRYHMIIALLASTEANNRDFEDALTNIKKVVSFAEAQNLETLSLKQKEDVVGIYLLATVVFEKSNQINKAATYYNKGWNIIEDIAKQYPNIYADTYFSHVLNDINIEKKSDETERKLNLHLSKYKSLAEEEPAIYDIHYASLLARAGIYYCLSNDTIRSNQYLSKATSKCNLIIEENPNKYTSDIIEEYYTIGEYFLRNGRLDQASVYFDKSEEYSKKNDVENSQSAYARLVKNIGEEYYYMTDYKIAEEYYLRSCEIYEVLSKADTMLYALPLMDTYNDLSYICNIRGHSDLSLAYDDKSLEIGLFLYKKNPSIYKIVYAKMLTNSIQKQIQGGNYSIADKRAKESLDIIMSIDSTQLEENKSLLMLVYNSLGDINSHYMRTDLAEKYLMKAYSIFLEIDKKEDIEYSFQNELSIYQSIGNFYNKNEKLDLAQKYLIEGIEKYEQNSDLEKKKSYPIYVSLKRTLGITYLYQKEIDKALPILLESIDNYSNLHGEDRKAILLQSAYIFKELGAFYLENKEYEEAFSFLNRALKEQKEIVVETDWDIRELALAYFNLGRYYNAIDSLDNAIELLAESRSLLSKLAKEEPGIHLNFYVDVTLLLGRIFVKAEKYDDFIQLESGCISELDSIVEKDNSYNFVKFNMLVSFSDLYINKFQDIERAIHHLDKANKMYVSLVNKSDVKFESYIELYRDAIIYYGKKKDYVSSKKYIDEAISFYEQLDTETKKKLETYKHLLNNDLAIVYLNSKEGKEKGIELLKGYIKHIESKENASLNDKHILLQTYNNVINYLTLAKSYQEAKAMLEKSTALLSDFSEIDNDSFLIECLVTRCHIGNIALIDRDISKANQEFQKVTGIFEYCLQKDSIKTINEIGNLLLQISYSYFKEGYKDECSKYLSYILDKTEAVSDELFFDILIQSIKEYNTMQEYGMLEIYQDYLHNKASITEDKDKKHSLLSMFYFLKITQTNSSDSEGVKLISSFLENYLLVENGDVNTFALAYYIYQLIRQYNIFGENEFVTIESFLTKLSNQLKVLIVNMEDNVTDDLYEVLFDMGQYYWVNNSQSEAVAIFDIIVDKIKDTECSEPDNKLTYIYGQSCYSTLFYYINENELDQANKALNNGLNCLSILLQTEGNSAEYIAVTNKMMAQLYSLGRIYDKAKECYSVLTRYLKEEAKTSAQNKMYYCTELRNFANIYIQDEDYESAITILKEGAKVCEEILADNQDDKQLLMLLISIYSGIYSSSNIISNYDDAMLYGWLQASLLDKHSNLDLGISGYDIYLDCVNTLLAKNEIERAKSYFDKISDPEPVIIRYAFYKSIYYLINNKEDEAVKSLSAVTDKIENMEHKEYLCKILSEQMNQLSQYNKKIQDNMSDKYLDVFNSKIKQ